MDVSKSQISRRWMIRFLAGSPYIAGLPAYAAPPPSDEQQITSALREIHLPFSPAHLDVISYDHGYEANAYALNAVIRLNWPPGLRQRRFHVTGANFGTALKALQTHIQARLIPAR